MRKDLILVAAILIAFASAGSLYAGQARSGTAEESNPTDTYTYKCNTSRQCVAGVEAYCHAVCNSTGCSCNAGPT